MTGWTKQGLKAHQREKVYTIILASSTVGLTNYELAGECWKSNDEVIRTIKPPTIRRIVSAELEKSGYIYKGSDGKWRITAKVFERQMVA